MCSGVACIGYLFFATIVGFAILIYFGLKYRKAFLTQNLAMTVDQIWSRVADRATSLHLSKSDLIYGLWQDKGSTQSQLLIRDSSDADVGRVDFTIGKRQFALSARDEKFEIVFPLTWNRTAMLKAHGSETILAIYSKTGFFGRHTFDIPGYGQLASERPSLNLNLVFNYLMNNQLVGTTQEISASRKIGRLGLFFKDIPLAVRIFVLAI